MFRQISVLAVAAVTMLAVSNSHVDAQDVPFLGFGSNGMYDPASGDFYATGQATHLGRLIGIGNVQSEGDLFPAPGVFFEGTFAGSQVFIGANGDLLEADLHGDVLLVFTEDGLVTGTWTVSWDITGGTGRFEGVTGATSGEAINPPFDPFAPTWPFDWHAEGMIDLAK